MASYGKFAPLGALLLLTLAGCGEADTIGKTVPVSGTVTVDGAPLKQGGVVFIPDDKKDNKTKAGVQGSVKDGAFTLTSSGVTTNKPGAPPGWYKVVINGNAPMAGTPSAVSADPKKIDLKATTSTGTTIAPEYSDAMRTPLSVEVKEGNTYALKVKSK